TPRVIQVSYNTLVKTEQAEQKNATQTQAAKDAARDTKPSFLNSAKHNFTAGLQGKLNYQFGLFGRGYITFALFLAGLVVGRIRFFEKEQPVRKLLTLFIGFLCVVFLTEIIAGMFPGINYRSLVSGQAENLASGLALMSLNDVKIVAFSGAIVMAFALLYQHKNWSKYLDVFSPYGRMGLTNYEMQGVIGCFMFSMWAFGLYFQSL